MENQNNLEKNNNSFLELLKKPWTLPILLATFGVIIFLFWILPNALSSGLGTILVLIGSFIVFPFLLVFISIIRIKKRPLMSGFFIFLVGCFYLFPFLCSMGDDSWSTILVLISLFLIFSGIFAMASAKRILEKQGREIPKHYKTTKFLLIIFSIIIFLFIGYVESMSLGPGPRSCDRNNVHRKSDMLQIVTAQEMYCGKNEIYLTNDGIMGIPNITGYLDAPEDPRNTLHPNYVWLKNDGGISGCITGEYFCVYATLEGEPIKYYAASEQGTKEVDFIPGSIGGIYGIDHCNCFDARDKTAIPCEKTLELEKSQEQVKKQEEETENKEIFIWKNFWNEIREQGCYTAREINSSEKKISEESLEWSIYGCSEIKNMTTENPLLHKILLEGEGAIENSYRNVWACREEKWLSGSMSISWGDVTGDKEKDVIVLYSGGAAGRSHYVGVFQSRKNGYNKLLDKNIRYSFFRVENAQLVEKVPLYLFNEAECCPSNHAHIYYKFIDGKLEVDKIIDDCGYDITDIYSSLRFCDYEEAKG